MVIYDCNVLYKIGHWLLPIAVIGLHVGGLHAVVWGDGLLAFVAPVEASGLCGSGGFKKAFVLPAKKEEK